MVSVGRVAVNRFAAGRFAAFSRRRAHFESARHLNAPFCAALRALQSTRLWGPGNPSPNAGSVVVKRADYSFAELSLWRDMFTEAMAVARTAGVVFSDLDEAHNRLTFGIADEAARARVEAMLRDLGIPTRAARYELSAPFEDDSRLSPLMPDTIEGTLLARLNWLPRRHPVQPADHSHWRRSSMHDWRSSDMERPGGLAHGFALYFLEDVPGPARFGALFSE
jgi:hypothetical protein